MNKENFSSNSEIEPERRNLYQQYHPQIDNQELHYGDNEEYYQVSQKKWPFLLWIYLKSLGLYHEGTYFLKISLLAF